MNRLTNNKTLLFIIGVLLLTNIALALYCFAWRGHYPKAGSREKRESGMYSFLQGEIGFDSMQLKSFDSLKQAHRAGLRPYFEEMARSRDSLYHTLGNPGQPADLERLADSIGRKQAEIEKVMFRNFLHIRSLCRPDQLPRFDSLMPGLVHRLMMPQHRNGPGHSPGRNEKSPEKK
jgi:periplasmic protein CpxP/Spy